MTAPDIMAPHPPPASTRPAPTPRPGRFPIPPPHTARTLRPGPSLTPRTRPLRPRRPAPTLPIHRSPNLPTRAGAGAAGVSAAVPGSLSSASGLILVETLLDLARPWPLKVAVDNAIGGRPLAVVDGLGPAGVAAVAAVAGIGLVGLGRWWATTSRT